MRCLFRTILPLVILTSALSAQSKREYRDEDAKLWRSTSAFGITRDGKWLVYSSTPPWTDGGATGEAVVIARSLTGSEERRYSAGESAYGGGSPTLSPSGLWFGFLVAPTKTEGDRLSAAKKPIRTALALVELATGKRVDIPDARSFSFLGGARDRVLVGGYMGEQDSTAYDLSARDVAAGEAVTIHGVRSELLRPDSQSIALVTTRGLELWDLSAATPTLLEADSANAGYSALTWSGRGGALAAIRRGREIP
jgi:hypothetical protein